MNGQQSDHNGVYMGQGSHAPEFWLDEPGPRLTPL